MSIRLIEECAEKAQCLAEAISEKKSDDKELAALCVAVQQLGICVQSLSNCYEASLGILGSLVKPVAKHAGNLRVAEEIIFQSGLVDPELLEETRRRLRAGFEGQQGSDPSS